MRRKSTLSISIDQRTVENYVNYITEETFESTEYKDLLEKDLNYVKLTASNFLLFLSKKEKLLNELTLNLNRQREMRNSFKDYKTLDNYVTFQERNKEIFALLQVKEIYNKMETFQKSIFKVLGKELKIVYVKENNGDPILYDITEVPDIRSEELDTRQLFTQRYRELESFNNIKTVNVETKNLDKAKTAYSKVLHRFNSYNKRVIWINQHRNWIYDKKFWQDGKDYSKEKWLKMHVSAKGDINEGYAGIVLNNYHKEMQGGEYDVDMLMEQIALVDNIPGLFEGDINLKNIDYQIKSADASSMGITQVIKLAKSFLSNEKFNIEMIKQEQQKIANRRFRGKGGRRNFLSKLEDEIKDVAEEELNDFLLKMASLDKL